MKKDFFDYLIKAMNDNQDIYFVSCDLGYPRTSEIEERFPDRFIWTGASEAIASDICVGLSYSGKFPCMYTISPFFYRCWETLRTYFNREKLPVLLVGCGVDGDYSDEGDGYSHDARDIKEMFLVLKNFKKCYPESKEEMEQMLTEAIENKCPTFINIYR